MTGSSPARPEVKAITIFSKIGVNISIYAIIVMTALVALNTAVRAIPFFTSLKFVEEYTGYLVVAMVFLGLAWTLRTDGHVRMGLVADRLPPRVKAGWEASTTLAAIVIIWILFWHSTTFFILTLKTGERAQTVTMTPLWIPRLMLLPGYLALLLELAVHLVWKIKEFRWLSRVAREAGRPESSPPEETL